MVPFGAVGAPGGYGALAIMATPTHGGVGLQCPGERPIATPTVQQTRAVLTACQHDAPSVLGGSLRLRWSQHDTVVVVSVPGPSDTNRRLVVTWPTTRTLSDPQGVDPNKGLTLNRPAGPWVSWPPAAAADGQSADRSAA